DPNARQGAPHGPPWDHRPHLGLEEGDRHAAVRPAAGRPVRELVEMPVRKYKPTSPGRRFMATSSFEEITATEPEKSLLEKLPSNAGRNNQGKVTVRHRGGDGRRTYRRIDFRRDKFGVPGKVATIEYDPNRTARIAVVSYADGEKRYILAPLGLRVGGPILSCPE